MPTKNENHDFAWWKTGIIYQIYPRSFKDGNGDGTGDLEGIISKLDYLSWLGIDIIWISPVYPSPMADFGYDISDYTAIDPIFGDMRIFDRLLHAIHSRGMKLIMDLVPNHTSAEHAWFKESRSSRDNPKRDWYIWRPPRTDGSPPNNWLAAFGGSAWEWDSLTNEYYLHSFLKEQPDLNWWNDEVVDAMTDVMRFWLDRGVDGFRIDVLWHLIKDRHLRDNPPNPAYMPHMATYEQLLPVYSTDQPEVHDIVRRFRSTMEAYPERVMIGEIYLPVDRLVAYYGQDSKGVHLPFNFQLIFLPWSAPDISLAINQYEGALPADGWPNWVLGNHDQVRIASRIGYEQSKIAAMLLLTLHGTPTIYYGEEIGMKDVPIPAQEIQDPMGLNMPDKYLSRDPARTPMQWDQSEYAGFSGVKPWLRVSSSYERINVLSEKEDRYSFLTLYKKLIALRQSEPSLHSGNYIPVGNTNQWLAYKRQYAGHKSFLIVLNFTHRPCYFYPEGELRGHIVAATSPQAEGGPFNSGIDLNGDEGVIIELYND